MSMSTLTDHVEAMVSRALSAYLDPDDDVVEYDVVLQPLASGTEWIPSLMLYLQLQPIGDVDGTHELQFESPYAITQELVDLFVKQFAERTVELRQRRREARAQGAQPVVGVAVIDQGS